MSSLLVATDRWRPDGGGRERYLEELVAHASDRGRPVSVLCGSPAAAAVFGGCTVARGVRPLRAHRLRAAVCRARTADPRLAVIALSPIRGATHYQLHDGLFEQAFAAEREAMRSRARRAFMPLAQQLNSHRRRLIDDQVRVVARAQAVMAFSDSTAAAMVRRACVPTERVTVSRPGVDLSRFHPASSAEDGVPQPALSRNGALRFAFVGHNFALKGLQTAIEAVARLRREGVDAALTVAGGGRPHWYVSLAEHLGIAAAVRFAGVLTPAETANLYRATDLLVHPTFYDPFPRVVVEAVASGCPVLTTARCGSAEILTHGVNGFVVEDPRDATTIAQLAATLTTASRRSNMRRAAADAGRRFDARAHFDEVLEWLDVSRS
jgi:UDP-glucose:(heptosyl)LPS alpha-1,3-glucosyltransferase